MLQQKQGRQGPIVYSFYLLLKKQYKNRKGYEFSNIMLSQEQLSSFQIYKCQLTLNFIMDRSLGVPKVQEVIDHFSIYLQDVVYIINDFKKCISDILHIELTPNFPNFQLNLPSINIQCKKTIDDMKRIGSILRGYSKSKIQADQSTNQRRKRIDSKQSQSGKSSANQSRVRAKQLLKQINDEKSRISNQSCKFQQAQENSNRLKNYRSLGHLQTPDFVILQQSNKEHGSSRASLQNIDRQLINLQNLNNQIGSRQLLLSYSLSKQNTGRKGRIVQDFEDLQKQSITSKTQTKFKQCLIHHKSGINQIISRNNECLLMIKQIQNKVIRKKNKGKRLKQNLKAS